MEWEAVLRNLGSFFGTSFSVNYYEKMFSQKILLFNTVHCTGSELKSDHRSSKGKGVSSTGRNSTSQPDRIDLKKILPRPGFEAGDDTTADDSSVGAPEGGVKRASKEENSVLRQQLAAMETIYKNVQSLVGGVEDGIGAGVGTSGSGAGAGSVGSKNGVDAIGSGSDEDGAKTSRLHQKSLKRLARLEGHVVTLARSVAHLSSELRSQHLLSQDIEVIKENIKVISRFLY